MCDQLWWSFCSQIPSWYFRITHVRTLGVKGACHTDKYPYRLPSVVFYLSQFYTRGELARRVGVFYAASSISGVSRPSKGFFFHSLS